MLDFSKLCVERPLGTVGNNAVINLLRGAFEELDFAAVELPLECTVWQGSDSFAEQNGNRTVIFPSPYSRGLKGTYPVKYVSTLAELQAMGNYDGVLIFTGELSQSAKMPNNFPFYFPEEDKMIYELLAKINPKGVIAITGQDQASGLNPFPLFKDANLEIPTAYASSLENITEAGAVSIEINSKTHREKSAQMIFRKEGRSKDIILISAHMDSKYFTNGAMDNAAGVYALLEIANWIRDKSYNHTIEIVPFNGEEHPEVSGQLAYLEYLGRNNHAIKHVINIDGAGHRGAENMFSFLNYGDDKKAEIVGGLKLREGEPWYSGDHAMFAFQNIPCVAVTSSDMFTDAIRLTHTPKDTADVVDTKLIKALGETVADMIAMIDG